MQKKIEQPIVDKVREILHNSCGYPLPSTIADANNIIVYEQDSYKANIELKTLLTHSSKCTAKTQSNLWTTNADLGKPEFVIVCTEQNLAVVIECKVNIAQKHIGKKLKDENILENKSTIISRYAVEGALHYAKFLSDTYDVIAIGITGDLLTDGDVAKLNISTYAWEKNKKWIEGEQGPFINLNIDSLLSYNEYIRAFDNIDNAKKILLESTALQEARIMNEILHKASVPPIERSLLVSGLLLALKGELFLSTYKNKRINSEKLLKLLDDSIADTLNDLKVADSFKREMLRTKFKDVFNQQGLLKDNARVLRIVLTNLENKVYPCMNGDFSLDIIGNFYSEFLRYAKGDKQSGIVLTPSHITELFCDLVDINISDSILDPCSGTASFLITAMNHLYNLAEKQPNSDVIKARIKSEHLYGCDDDKQMFALGCSNMILRGDGQANMFYGSCMDHKNELENKATIGMINPPYSGTDISCLEFIDFLCYCIRHKNEKGEWIGKNRARGENLVCAIIPVTYMNSEDYKNQRIKLLENNTLVGVMSMPIDLFRPINIVTCIVLLKAGVPHDNGIPTYLGNWKDDGYIWKKGLGRIADGEKPSQIKEKWLKSFKRTVENKDIGIWKCLDGSDECCWERYAETDYSKITQELFENEVKNFMLYQLREVEFSDLVEEEYNNEEENENSK